MSSSLIMFCNKNKASARSGPHWFSGLCAREHGSCSAGGLINSYLYNTRSLNEGSLKFAKNAPIMDCSRFNFRQYLGFPDLSYVCHNIKKNCSSTTSAQPNKSHIVASDDRLNIRAFTTHSRNHTRSTRHPQIDAIVWHSETMNSSAPQRNMQRATGERGTCSQHSQSTSNILRSQRREFPPSTGSHFFCERFVNQESN